MMKKRTMFGVLLVGFTLAACSTKSVREEKAPVRVETERVQRSDGMESMASYVGEVEPVTETAVSFPGGGTVMQVLVGEGQRVTKGQLLAVMDDTNSRNNVMGAEASMAQARDVYDRMKMLHDSQSISEMEWVRVQTALEQAKSNLQKMQKGLADCRLTAPCSGVVGTRNVEPGMTVMGAQTVCTILDINRVKVRISVPEREIAAVSDRAVVAVASLDNLQFESVGFERGITSDAVSRTYDVRYFIDNHDRKLLPGMICEVRPENSHLSSFSSQQITVPITSVRKSADNRMFVWTVKDGVAHRAMVRTGRATGNRIGIVSGITEGDVIVTKGYQKLSEGTKVMLN